MTVTLDPAISWTIGLSLGLLLALGALHKLRDPGEFRAALSGYQLVPTRLLGPAAAAVITAELATVLLLLLPARRPVGGLAAAALMAVYGAAIGLNLVRGRTRIDCGCLGFGKSERIAWWMVGRNVALAALALTLRLPAGTRDLEAFDWLTVAGTVAVGAALFGAASRLASLPSLRGRAA